MAETSTGESISIKDRFRNLFSKNRPLETPVTSQEKSSPPTPVKKEETPEELLARTSAENERFAARQKKEFEDQQRLIAKYHAQMEGIINTQLEGILAPKDLSQDTQPNPTK